MKCKCDSLFFFSVGEQLFSIQIVNATIAYKMKVEILDPSLNWNPMSGCQPSL